MNLHRFRARWRQWKGRAQEAWGSVTEDPVLETLGKREQVLGFLQESEGYFADENRSEADGCPASLSRQPFNSESSSMELVTVSKHGVTVVKHVWATIDVFAQPWSGSFNVSENVELRVGERYEIRTLDGRHATIRVQSSLASLPTAGLPTHSGDVLKAVRPQNHVKFLLEGALVA